MIMERCIQSPPHQVNKIISVKAPQRSIIGALKVIFEPFDRISTTLYMREVG